MWYFLLFFRPMFLVWVLLVIYWCCLFEITLQENASLVTNFNDQKLLVTIITNLDTSLQSKTIIGY